MNKKNALLIKITYLLFLLVMVGQIGCASALLAPIYLLKGGLVDPEFKKQVKEIPKESKMLVVCRSSVHLYGAANPKGDLAHGLTYLLSNKISKKKKLVWIPSERIEGMFDDETLALENFAKIGRKVGADYVVGVDLDSFNTQVSSQFYQGKAKVHLQLVEVESGEVLARKSMPEYTYPPTPVPINNTHSSEFQKRFTMKLASEIGTLFYPFDPHDKYALDSDFADR